jgi:uncharacterized protein (TIGR00290 family)
VSRASSHADRVLLAWSGGKDSSLALAALRADPSVEVVGLVTAVTPEFDRISIHGVRRAILTAQVHAIRLPVFEAALEPSSSNEEYEAAWAGAVARAVAAVGPVRALAYGDLFLADVREYRERLAERLSLAARFPLWGLDTRELAARFVADGYEAYLTCVDTTQLDASFAGRRFDARFLADLPASVDPCGERGEFHTCVVAGPVFDRSIRVQVGERVRRDGRFEYCDLVPA